MILKTKCVLSWAQKNARKFFFIYIFNEVHVPSECLFMEVTNKLCYLSILIIDKVSFPHGLIV